MMYGTRSPAFKRHSPPGAEWLVLVALLLLGLNLGAKGGAGADGGVPHNPRFGCARLQQYLSSRDGANCTCKRVLFSPDRGGWVSQMTGWPEQEPAPAPPQMMGEVDCQCWNGTAQTHPLPPPVQCDKWLRDPVPTDPSKFPFIEPARGLIPYIVDHWCTSKFLMTYSDQKHTCPLQHDPSLLKEGDFVFVDMGNVANFIKYVLPRLSKHFHIISIGSDCPLSPFSIPYQPRLLESKLLLSWWSTNTNSTDPRVHTIPLGLHSTMKRKISEMSPRRTSEPLRQTGVHAQYYVETKFQRCQEERARLKVEGVNFTRPSGEWGPMLKGHCFRHHVAAWTEPMVRFRRKTVSKRAKDSETYFRNILSASYILSPQGNGWDTYRTYETLIMGRLPVVSELPHNNVYSRLPVLQVHDWRMLDKPHLKSKRESLKLKQCSWEGLSNIHLLMRIWGTCLRTSSQFGGRGGL